MRPERWDVYEEAVMAGRDDVEPPGDDYEMSETFKQWVVDRMREEVMGQISAAGLDRMAVVKGAESEDARADGTSDDGGQGGDDDPGVHATGAGTDEDRPRPKTDESA